VIAVFTKYDQFKRDMSFKLEDKGRDPRTDLEDEAESIFRQHYLAGLGCTPSFVRLESKNLFSTIRYCADFCPAGMHKDGRPTDLIEMTARALSDDAVAIMLLAVQKDNLEPNIKQAIKW
jgi:hypothetical protein